MSERVSSRGKCVKVSQYINIKNRPILEPTHFWCRPTGGKHRLRPTIAATGFSHAGADKLKIKKVFHGDVENIGDTLATLDRRRIYPAFNKTDKFDRIAGFLSKLSLRQFSSSSQCRNSSAEFSFKHAVKLCACRESLNGVKLRLLL